MHDFKVGLLKILYFGNPVLLDKSIMERVIRICPKVFFPVEMDRYPEGMGILWTDLTTDPKVFYPRYSGKFLRGREKIGFRRRTPRMLETKGYGVFHVKGSLRLTASRKISHSAIWIVLSILPFVEWPSANLSS